MSLPFYKRYQVALDNASGIVLTALGLVLTASMLFVGA
jgi:hypothetical protein